MENNTDRRLKVAVIGDGQLARMMQTAAVELGIDIHLLAGSEDASAAQVISQVSIGDYTNLDDLRRVVDGVDAVTFDHEHVPNEHLNALLEAGITVEPRPAALIHAQDKLIQRTKMQELGLPVPPFAAINSVEDIREFYTSVDGHVCIKATRGGYDGHGVWFPDTDEEAEILVSELLEKNVPLMAEKKVPFTRELSAMIARNRSGELRSWPVVESIQENGMCRVATAPAPNLEDELAKQCQKIAETIAAELDVTGVMAVELFEYTDEAGRTQVSINELAMRPHNTGHWTQEGSVTSQFEQHLRAVLDLPLGDESPIAPVTVMVNTLGAEEEPKAFLPDRIRKVMELYPQAKVHLYGKQWRPGRKLGHVNVRGQSVDSVRAEAEAAANILVHGESL